MPADAERHYDRSGNHRFTRLIQHEHTDAPDCLVSAAKDAAGIDPTICASNGSGHSPLYTVRSRANHEPWATIYHCVTVLGNLSYR